MMLFFCLLKQDLEKTTQHITSFFFSLPNPREKKPHVTPWLDAETNLVLLIRLNFWFKYLFINWWYPFFLNQMMYLWWEWSRFVDTLWALPEDKHSPWTTKMSFWSGGRCLAFQAVPLHVVTQRSVLRALTTTRSGYHGHSGSQWQPDQGVAR